MSSIRIYGKKGMIEAVPFEVNSVDLIPEPIGEEENIINSSPNETEENQDPDN